MRIILKIIAAPAVLALTLIVAVLNFSVSLASWVLGILSLVLAVCGLFELFIQSNPQWGITGLVLAFFPLSGCPPQPNGWSASWMILPTR